MADLEFGTKVLLRAQTVRVVSSPVLGQRSQFRQAQPGREGGRYVVHEFDAAGWWPGEPIPSTWSEHAEQFNPDPDPAKKVYVRLRRIETEVPAAGIVIGSVRRSEGTVVPTRGDSAGTRASNDLAAPLRISWLYEVALQPVGRKARIVLAHPLDLAAVPAARRLAG